MVRHVLVVLALCGVGCGGTVVGPGTDAAGDGPELQDAGTDAPPSDGATDRGQPWSPICPVEQPTVGSACSLPTMPDSPELLCEYGKLQFDPGCDTILTCQGGVWAAATPGTGACQPDGPNSTTCPATYAAGGGCSDDGLRCAYPEGVCVCSEGFGGPIRVDAGTSWYCDPGAGCPMPRPRLGASCSTSAMTCTYLDCEFGETCQNGFWQGEFEGCAKAGGHAP